MKLAPGRVDRLIWIAIYGGLFVASVGFALQQGGAGYGWGVVAVGAVATVAGIVMIWIRSRMREPPGP